MSFGGVGRNMAGIPSFYVIVAPVTFAGVLWDVTQRSPLKGSQGRDRNVASQCYR